MAIGIVQVSIGRQREPRHFDILHWNSVFDIFSHSR